MYRYHHKQEQESKRGRRKGKWVGKVGKWTQTYVQTIENEDVFLS